MKNTVVLTALAALSVGGLLASPAALAANAKHPYSHVNHKNDAGNRSGDTETAKLNEQQLTQHQNGQ